MTVIIHPIVAVPPCSPSTHLHQPRPYPLRRRGDRYGMHDSGHYIKNQSIAWKGTLTLDTRGTDACEGDHQVPQFRVRESPSELSASASSPDGRNFAGVASDRAK